MAVSLGWRLAVKLAPAGGAAAYRVLKWSEGPGVSTATDLWNRLLDPSESDEDLTVALSAARGYASEVATFSGAFESRRVQINFRVATSALLDEDVRVCTFHHVKTSGGSPVDTWDSTDFENARDNYLAWWAEVKKAYLPDTKLESIKFYREGPGIEPPQPPVYSHEPTPIAGTSGSSTMFPPQVAISVTEKTSIRKAWGRFYLPAPAASIAATAGTIQLHNADGLIPNDACAFFADASDALYEACLTDNIPIVVYRKAAGTALTVDNLQVDNLFDVIRSRRYDKPTLRVQRAVG
jgi:hypothetical protein